MLVCGCGNWMHTQGVDEQSDETDASEWMVRLECRRCNAHVGAVGISDEAVKLVDRFMWSDEARHALDRLPPYVQSLVKPEAEAFVRNRQQRVMTSALFSQARNGGLVAWDADAEHRL
jgi:hypothetical protein